MDDLFLNDVASIDAIMSGWNEGGAKPATVAPSSSLQRTLPARRRAPEDTLKEHAALGGVAPWPQLTEGSPAVPGRRGRPRLDDPNDAASTIAAPEWAAPDPSLATPTTAVAVRAGRRGGVPMAQADVVAAGSIGDPTGRGLTVPPGQLLAPSAPVKVDDDLPWLSSADRPAGVPAAGVPVAMSSHHPVRAVGHTTVHPQSPTANMEAQAASEEELKLQELRERKRALLIDIAAVDMEHLELRASNDVLGIRVEAELADLEAKIIRKRQEMEDVEADITKSRITAQLHHEERMRSFEAEWAANAAREREAQRVVREDHFRHQMSLLEGSTAQVVERIAKHEAMRSLLRQNEPTGDAALYASLSDSPTVDAKVEHAAELVVKFNRTHLATLHEALARIIHTETATRAQTLYERQQRDFAVESASRRDTFAGHLSNSLAEYRSFAEERAARKSRVAQEVIRTLIAASSRVRRGADERHEAALADVEEAVKRCASEHSRTVAEATERLRERYGALRRSDAQLEASQRTEVVHRCGIAECAQRGAEETERLGVQKHLEQTKAASAAETSDMLSRLHSKDLLARSSSEVSRVASKLSDFRVAIANMTQAAAGRMEVLRYRKPGAPFVFSSPTMRASSGPTSLVATEAERSIVHQLQDYRATAWQLLHECEASLGVVAADRQKCEALRAEVIAHFDRAAANLHERRLGEHVQMAKLTAVRSSWEAEHRQRLSTAHSLTFRSESEERPSFESTAFAPFEEAAAAILERIAEQLAERERQMRQLRSARAELLQKRGREDAETMQRRDNVNALWAGLVERSLQMHRDLEGFCNQFVAVSGEEAKALVETELLRSEANAFQQRRADFETEADHVKSEYRAAAKEKSKYVHALQQLHEQQMDALDGQQLLALLQGSPSMLLGLGSGAAAALGVQQALEPT